MAERDIPQTKLSIPTIIFRIHDQDGGTCEYIKKDKVTNNENKKT